MESLRLSFEAILPIFLLMALGYVLKSIKMAEESTFNAINKLVFKVFLPVLLFYNVYTTESLEIFDFKLIGFTIISILVVFIIGYFIAMAITKENPRRGVILQGIYRSNFAILGIPLVDYICGDNVIGIASMMVATIIPLFNILAVVALERFRDGKLHILKMLKGVITNPLIIGCGVGMVFLLLGIKMPKAIEKGVSDVAKIATPLAIITLGASFKFKSLKGYVKEVLVVTSAKLVIVPLIGISLGVMLGFRGEALACLLVIFGSPVAVSSFAMSQQMGGDADLAALDVVITSVACIFTLFLWIFALSFFGLF